MELVVFGDDGEVEIIIEATIWTLEPKSESSRWRGRAEMKLDGIVKKNAKRRTDLTRQKKSRKMGE